MYNFLHINLNVWCLIVTIVIGLIVQLICSLSCGHCREDKPGKLGSSINGGSLNDRLNGPSGSLTSPVSDHRSSSLKFQK